MILLQTFDLICNNFGISKDIDIFSKELVLGVCVHIKELDNLISKTSQHWRLGRIAKVDHSILRLAVYELLYKGDIPPKVSINEAVDLGKNLEQRNQVPLLMAYWIRFILL